MKSIILIIDYFANSWPDWFPVFIESCRKNSTINWLIHTNCPEKINLPPNVEIKFFTEYEYCKKISDSLGVYFYPSWNYKLVDIKPAYGKIWEEEIKEYDFWGYSDIDIIYGNLRDFLTDKLLSTKKIFSTHNWCLAGHFSIFKNCKWSRELFTRIKDWKKIFSSDLLFLFDEKIFIESILPRYRIKIFNIFNYLKKFKYSINEMWTTPLTHIKWEDKYENHPTEWYLIDGKLTNNVDKHEHIYLHFMNYKKKSINLDRKYGEKAPWEDKKQISFVPEELIQNNLVISFDGIFSKDTFQYMKPNKN